MNYRKRFQEVMHFRSVDRLPFCEFLGYWNETINRWYGEGLPAGVDVDEYFGFDKGLTPSPSRPTPSVVSLILRPGREVIPIDFGPVPRFVPRTLEENDRYRVVVDGWGATKKVLKTRTSIPSFISFPVKGRKDFKVIKKRFQPDDPRRYPVTWCDELIEYYETLDHPLGIQFPGFFGVARQFMGLETLLITFHREPELIHEIMNFWADFIIETIRPAVEAAEIDYITFWEDMSYNAGPFISPKLFREFMVPCYKKVTSFVKKNGIDISMVDTDGNHEVLMPLFLEGGVNCLYPLEVQAGMDAIALRKKYGKRLLLMGNIDKKALIKGGKAVEREINLKLTSLMKEGGYVPCVDHCVPADVSFQNYKYYVRLLRENITIE